MQATRNLYFQSNDSDKFVMTDKGPMWIIHNPVTYADVLRNGSLLEDILKHDYSDIQEYIEDESTITESVKSTESVKLTESTLTKSTLIESIKSTVLNESYDITKYYIYDTDFSKRIKNRKPKKKISARKQQMNKLRNEKNKLVDARRKPIVTDIKQTLLVIKHHDKQNDNPTIEYDKEFDMFIDDYDYY